MTAIPARAPADVSAAAAPGSGRTAGNRWVYLLLVGGLVFMVGPFLWMLLGSIKPQADFLTTPTILPSSTPRLVSAAWPATRALRRIRSIIWPSSRDPLPDGMYAAEPGRNADLQHGQVSRGRDLQR